MRCVYMGKHKRSVVGGLGHLLATGWDVAAVVAPPAGGRGGGGAAAGPGGGDRRPAAGVRRRALRGDRESHSWRARPRRDRRRLLVPLLEAHPPAGDRAWPARLPSLPFGAAA